MIAERLNLVKYADGEIDERREWEYSSMGVNGGDLI